MRTSFPVIVKMDSSLLRLCVLATLAVFCVGDTCLSPQVSTDVYTTTDASMSSETVVVIEFSLTCKNGLKDLILFAEIDDKTIPTSRVLETNKYQVSWSLPHKKMPAGAYQVRFFDEEGYSSLRKAQRSDQDTSKISSLFTVTVNHPGASKGQWVQTESVAAIVSLVVWYYAYSTRSSLQK